MRVCKPSVLHSVNQKNLKLFARFFAAGHFAFILVDIYQYSVDVLPVDAANLGNNVFTLIFVALLLMKSRD